MKGEKKVSGFGMKPFKSPSGLGIKVTGALLLGEIYVHFWDSEGKTVSKNSITAGITDCF